MPSGNFGYVYKAKLRRRSAAMPARYVAVKELTKGNSTELVQEATLMMRIPMCPHVVRILGVCAQPPCMVMEFVRGVQDLDRYLPMVLHYGNTENADTADNTATRDTHYLEAYQPQPDTLNLTLILILILILTVTLPVTLTVTVTVTLTLTLTLILTLTVTLTLTLTLTLTIISRHMVSRL